MENTRLVTPVARTGTHCEKWDGLEERFGDKDLIAMWVADMDFQAPPCTREALAAYIEQGVFGYEQVHPDYVPAFIAWEKEVHQTEVKAEWIRFTPGVVAGFFWLVQMMTKPGDSVLVLSPVYYPFYNAIRINGRNTVACELVNENGVYRVDFEKFERDIVENDVKLFILCSPHNPVGRVWKREELEQMAAICRRHGVFIVSDEIHQDIIMPGHTQISMLRVAGEDEGLAVLTAGTKTFNLAGISASAAIIPGEKTRKQFDAFAQSIHVLSGNNFAYVALAASYRGGQPWLEEVLGIVWENYNFVCRSIHAMMPQAVISPLEGTYLMWVDLGAHIPAGEMKAFIQDECRIAVDYGDWFGGTGTKTCIRINLATPRSYVEAAMEQMKKAYEARRKGV